MSLLIIRLLHLLNGSSLDTTNYHIALKMLENYGKLPLMSIGDTAKLCNFSKSTISKFARQIGFDDYLDLKDNAITLENRNNSPLSYRSNILNAIEQEGFEEYLDAMIEDIQFFKESVDVSAIDKIVNRIKEFDYVVALGLIFSESAAMDLQYKLAYKGKFLRTFLDDTDQEHFLKEADENTLAIVLTNSGEYLTTRQQKLGAPKKDIFFKTKDKIIVISTNPQVKELPFVEEALIFSRLSKYQTHALPFT